MPAIQKDVNGLTYAKMHCDNKIGDISTAETYLNSFLELLNFMKERSNLDYELINYKQFQEVKFVREKLIEILNRESEFIPVIAPSEDHLRVRFPCPTCKFSEKQGKNTVIKKDIQGFVLENICPEDGKYQILLNADNKDFVDMNTPLRNVIKEALFIEEANKAKAMNLMVDGSDWIHMADFVVSEGLYLLGYNYKDRPTRFFTPLIEDWSGAKFSKSVYVKEGTYSSFPNGFLNLVEFKKEFGIEGIEILWKETGEWIKDPKKIFRNYSAEYLLNILRK